MDPILGTIAQIVEYHFNIRLWLDEIYFGFELICVLENLLFYFFCYEP